MQTMSVRLPTEDLEWLATHDVAGASSPSDKLRALVAQYRRQQEGSNDLATAMSWMRDLIAPLMTKIGAAEHRAGTHSEIVRLMGEWVPQTMALLIAENGINVSAQKNLTQLEERLATRINQLITATLRLVVTQSSDSYDPQVFDKYLPTIIELVGVIAASRKSLLAKENDNG
jgi:hypothetical protein